MYLFEIDTINNLNMPVSDSKSCLMCRYIQHDQFQILAQK